MNHSTSLYKQLLSPRLIPWWVAGLALLGMSLLRLAQVGQGKTWQGWGDLLLEAALAMLVITGVFLLANAWLGHLQERNALKAQLAAQVRLVEQANERLAAVFRLRQHFLDASDESEVVEWLLRLTGELKGVMGASFVPLDEHGQPLATQGFGSQPLPVTEAWVEYLASPAVRDRCKVCENHNHLSTSCPLLKGPFSESLGIYCLPVRWGEREFGVLNLYVQEVEMLDAETRLFLQSLVDETAIGLEGIWLRKRELSALRQLQSVRQKADLGALLSGLLENVQQTLEADFVVLEMDDSHSQSLVGEASEENRYQESSICGEFPAQARPFVNGIIQGVIESAEPVILSNVTNKKSNQPGVWSVLAVPLLAVDQSPIGAVLVGNHRAVNFRQRQLALLQTVAGQLTLVVQNTRQVAELQFKAMMEERTRLAREIHDGLAQTLGFLKLQSAQMLSYLERGDYQRLKQGIHTYYDTLSAAYQDARYAIDGLRISPSGNQIHDWVKQTVAEFVENLDSSDLDVQLDCLNVGRPVPSEIQAQLIRILQEALSNIRKHASARHAWVSCYEQGQDLVLEIRDDGGGFSPNDVSSHSQHGLRGMRERAELIGADFQVISQPLQGTIVRVSLAAHLGEIVS